MLLTKEQQAILDGAKGETLAKVMKKAAAGEKITVAVISDSMGAGDGEARAISLSHCCFNAAIFLSRTSISISSSIVRSSSLLSRNSAYL